MENLRSKFYEFKRHDTINKSDNLLELALVLQFFLLHDYIILPKNVWMPKY